MPPNLKVAFIADQGLNSNSLAVLRLIKEERTDMVLHQGDFDYSNDPEAWDQQIDDVLGMDFPLFASVGNHDVLAWELYQQKLQERLERVEGANCTGDLGVNSACTYEGLFFILSGVGTLGTIRDDTLVSEKAAFIQAALDSDDAASSIWRICS